MHLGALGAATVVALLLQQLLPEGRSGALARLVPAAPEAVLVPAGEFVMGSTREDQQYAFRLCVDSGFSRCEPTLFVNEGPPRRVRTRAYRIGVHEVRNADFEACVRAGACPPRQRHRADRRFDGPDLPVVDVSYGDARAYCRWRGGRLPTEAEWERAARGPARRRFPWGDVWNGALCNHGQAAAPPRTDESDGFRYVAPVGSFPEGRSPFGALDMAGNVMEWVADWYAEDAYVGARVGAQRTGVFADPQGPDAGQRRVVRGGSWYYPSFTMRTTMRLAAVEEERSVDLGFRCAWDV